MIALVVAPALLAFWAFLCWRVRVEQGWVGLTEYDRRVLRLRLAILHAYEIIGLALLPVFRRFGEAFARAKPIFDALNEQMLADPRRVGRMILTYASGSGYYMVDEDGYVYTASHFDTRPAMVAHGIGPKPGERPDRKSYHQFAGGTAFWLRTGQGPEQLDQEQRTDLADARGQRDRLIELAEETADRIAELDQEREDLLRAVR